MALVGGGDNNAEPASGKCWISGGLASSVRPDPDLQFRRSERLFGDRCCHGRACQSSEPTNDRFRIRCRTARDPQETVKTFMCMAAVQRLRTVPSYDKNNIFRAIQFAERNILKDPLLCPLRPMDHRSLLAKAAAAGGGQAPDYGQCLASDSGGLPPFAAHVGAKLAIDCGIIRQQCILKAGCISYRCRCIDDKDT